MLPLTVTPIDASAGFEAALNAVTGAISTNQVAVFATAGGLMAIGILWRFTRKFVRP